ncbi:hypothetical protein BDP27DRAFT_1317043 [Rhodocollybia butyracea]|uniref:ER-bound oxygenase mpaB/mpaB'/Rubber oxygenase catalytic domain-containing protein n=1 Tax=Rhodocollybia butyracea TaxID=206335 RepID=A0A9P5Q492_9AGAR|nr:hypothetical protein BDP27DRAFT_1317043 [Rhodocollybia butyracea]
MNFPGFLSFQVVSSSHIAIISATSLTLYLSLVRALRWRRYNAMHRKYLHKYSELEGKGLTGITPEEAQDIIATSALYDMPALMTYALAFALFKTYAVPTISKILSDTKELESASSVSKRYADTEILISNWFYCPLSGKSTPAQREIDDPRAMIALARVNWLHSKYPIKNDDYLYTLGLFVFEPEKWARLYGWRVLSPLESHAFFIFWVEIGRRMGIRDIPKTAQLFKQWIVEYESTAVYPIQTNHSVAHYTTEELLHAVPEFLGLKNLARRLTICALDDNIRIAMMQPSQPRSLHYLLKFILHSVGFIQRYLCLPRSESNTGSVIDPSSDSLNTESNLNTSSHAPPLHRSHPKWFSAQPWYMPEPQTLWGKIKIWAAVKVFGLYDAMPGKELKSNGYRLEEMVSVLLMACGHDDVFRMAERLYGCPMTGKLSSRK